MQTKDIVSFVLYGYTALCTIGFAVSDVAVMVTDSFDPLIRLYRGIRNAMAILMFAGLVSIFLVR